MASAEAIPNPAFHSGPALVGTMMMYMCYGVLIRITVTYASNHTPGRHFYRNHAFLVGFVMLLVTMNLCFLSYAAWKRLVLDTAIPAHKWVPPPTQPAGGIFNGTVACCVQLFFARKVYVLGSAAQKKWGKWPGIGIAVLGVMHLCSAYATAIIFGVYGRTYRGAMDIVIALNNGTALAADLAITASMVYFLSHYKSRSSFSATKQLLTTITRHTLENGLIVSLTVTANVIVYYTREDNVHEAFRIVLASLYAIVLVTSLNRAHSAAQDSRNGTHSASISTNIIPLSQTGYGTANVITFDRDGVTSSGKRPFSTVQVQVAHEVQRSVSAPEMASDDALPEKVPARWDEGDSQHTRTQRERKRDSRV